MYLSFKESLICVGTKFKIGSRNYEIVEFVGKDRIWVYNPLEKNHSYILETKQFMDMLGNGVCTLLSEISEENKIFQVFSPDGISLFEDTHYNTKDDALAAFDKWTLRFNEQGYYSSVQGNIDLSELRDHCTLKVFDKTKCNTLELTIYSSESILG
ncbi:hypothetical protein [Tenacibaculum agarivorans]|uniref:hypothetical protein n=1 Tax=Tenacibaculum agarivorans TaxID=1908389 RepID=UPI00094BC13E|nr:hypothetical protein [Tenacibaculum agarivorans]